MSARALLSRSRFRDSISIDSRHSMRLAIRSFLLCLALLLTACLIGGMYPFGSTSLLREDAIYQYVGFFGWLSNVLNGKANLLYSLSKGLGGSTIGLYSYYLASPFNLVMGLFQPSEAPKVMSVLIIVKLCSMAATQTWFISRRFHSDDYVCVFSGLAYGLAMCNFVAGSNLMWLDGAILLPLMCYALHHFVNNRYPYLLSVLIALAILSNWYAGYQLCVFSVLWVIYEIVDLEIDKKEAVHVFLRYIRYMILGGLLSSILFVPTVFDLLKTGSAPTSSSGGSFISASNFYDLLSKWDITDTSIHPDSSGLAGGLFTCSILVASAFAFFSNRVSDKKSNRLLTVIVLLIVICEVFQPFSLVWTGFSRADSYNPRFHYLVIFVLCAMFAKTQVMKDTSKSELHSRFYYYPFVVIICLALYVLGYYAHIKMLLFQLVSLFLTTLFLARLEMPASAKRRASRLLLLVVIGFLFTIESVYPIVATFKFDESTPKLNVYDYSNYIDNITSLASDSDGESVTRHEQCGITYLGAANRTFPTSESLALGTHGVSHYSSAGRQSQKEILGSLGYCGISGTRGITYYNSSIPVSDVILGISDLITSDQAQYVYGAAQKGCVDSPFGTIQDLALNGKRSLAYRMKEDICNESGFSDDCFENQEVIAKSIFGATDLYLPLDPESDEVDLAGEQEERLVTYRVSEDGPIYAKVSSDAVCSVYANGKLIQAVNDWEFSSNIVSLGEFKTGDTVVLKLSGAGISALKTASIEVRELNTKGFSELLESAGNQAVNVVVRDDGYISMETNSMGSEYCFISVPYEEGWTATNNGQKCEIFNYHGFMAVRLSDGANEIKLTYRNSAVLIGFAVSLISGCILIVVAIKSGAVRKKRD